MPDQQTNSGDSGRQKIIQKGKDLLRFLEKFLNSTEGKATKAAIGMVGVNKELLKLAKVSDPKHGLIVITSVTFQKAMLAAGVATSDEASACLKALGALAADFGMAAALGPATLGLGALLPLALAASDSYDVGRSCFNVNGVTTHSITERRSDIETILHSSEHGPI